MENNELVHVNIKYDDSVKKKIEQNAIKLAKKYATRRKINEEKLTREKSKFEKIMSIPMTIIMILAVAFCITICAQTLISSINGTTPMYFGYSTMKVASNSMTAETITIKGVEYDSGFEVGENIVIRPVNTDTLKVGDKIAFYVYIPNIHRFYNTIRTHIDVPADTETEYTCTTGEFFGFQKEKLVEAVKDKVSGPYFHHIIEIFEDVNGERWFRTQGSANSSADTWVVSEDTIIGAYDTSKVGAFISNISAFVASDLGFLLLLLIPIGLITAIIISSLLNEVQLAFMELDVVEEKRKLTDEACIKNNIGYRMDKSAKYKVLSQASDDEKLYYISLLWKNGTAPASIKKYALRKKIMLESMKKKLELNRKCEQMHNTGVDINKIAEYYTVEKAKIDSQQEATEQRFKRMRKAYSKILNEQRSEAQKLVRQNKPL